MRFKDMGIQNVHIDIDDSLDKVMNLFFGSNRLWLPVTTGSELLGILSLEKCLKIDGHFTKEVDRDIKTADIDDEIMQYINAEQPIIPLHRKNEFVGFVDMHYVQSYFQTFESYKQKLQTYT